MTCTVNVSVVTMASFEKKYEYRGASDDVSEPEGLSTSGDLAGGAPAGYHGVYNAFPHCFESDGYLTLTRP